MGENRFKGKVAIVTGGGLGIGRETVLRFAREGAKVVIPDVELEAAQETQKLVEDSGGEALSLKVDVSDVEQVKSMAADAVERFGGIDILVNNAGTGVRSVLLETREEDWERTHAVDLRGVFLCIKYSAPEMIKSGGGRIINIASLTGLIGMGLAAYSAAKGGVISLTRPVAGELGVHGITVNTICPGFIATRLNEELRNSPMAEVLRNRIPLREFGATKHVAALTLFLASEEAEYITGTVIPVDGGLGSFLDLGEGYRSPED